MEPTKKTKSFLEVIIFDEDSGQLDASLGIIEERSEELINFVKEALEKVNNGEIEGYHQLFHFLSLKSKHINEFCFMQFAAIKLIDAQVNKPSLASLEGFLKFLKEGGAFGKDSDSE